MSVDVTTLESGLRVVSDHMLTVETVSVGAWVEVGARDEPAQLNGISHLLEHMAFKGTERRDAFAVAEEIESVGGHLNAYTSREHTAYFAKILKEDLALAVDLLADILQHSTMAADELSREQAVIVQEIHQAHDTPDDVVFDIFQEVAYPAQSMGRPVLGSADAIEAIARDDVIEYMRAHYSAPRIVFAAAGRVDHDRFVDLVLAAFNALPPHREAPRDPARYGGGERREAKPLEQTHIVLGLEGVAYDDPDFYAASTFSTLFGGGMSSRLFQEIREKRGLVYSIYSFLSCYTDSGLFGIYAGTGESAVDKLIPLICDEIEKVCDSVTAAEVMRARTQLKASVLMSLENPSSRCEQLARQVTIFNRPIPVSEMISKIEAIDRDAVRAIAQRLTSGHPTLTALGPAGELPSFESFAECLN
ncbi:MAG: pitrilysin family protein [Rhodospirillales bacterium]